MRVWPVGLGSAPTQVDDLQGVWMPASDCVAHLPRGQRGGDLLGDYDAFLDAIELNPAQRSQRRPPVR